MKILYFTGTGNCLAVAKKFNAELLSIPQMLNSNIYDIEADTVGIYILSITTLFPILLRDI